MQGRNRELSYLRPDIGRSWAQDANQIRRLEQKFPARPNRELFQPIREENPPNREFDRLEQGILAVSTVQQRGDWALSEALVS